MKYLKLYDNFEFNEDDFDFEEDDDNGSFQVGDKVICLKDINLNASIGHNSFVKGNEYEITNIMIDSNDDLLEIKPIWMVYKNYDKYEGYNRWEFKRYFRKKQLNESFDWTEDDFDIEETEDKWTTIIKDDFDTYPNEGLPVIATDGIHTTTVWFIMSGEYKWMKNDLENDTAFEFTSFEIKKWKYIT